MSRKSKSSHVESNSTKPRVVTLQTVDVSKYDSENSYRESSLESPRSIAAVAAFLESNPNAQFDGIVLGLNRKGELKSQRIDRKKFLESWKGKSNQASFKEDFFGSGTGTDASSVVGDDYVPLMGGPFNRQLYLTDALQQFSQAFYAYNHDPIARAIIQITVHFVLGRGFRVDAKHSDPKAQEAAQAIWKAFEKVNDFQQMCKHIVQEGAIYGEVMLQKLPDNQTRFAYDVAPGQAPPKGKLPRWVLKDPSSCWEVITYPEDIHRVIAYWFVYPTQYQITTAKDGGTSVPSMKFINQQIPADQMKHYKLNCVSNEKRGRSDLFPVLGYLKRLRDLVNYSVLARQKSSAWSIDTTVEGSQTDLDAYIESQEALGPIAPAASEFVHSKKVTRQYLGNQTPAGSGVNPGFEECMNMIAAGVMIPVSYFGLHNQGGASRASALVGTEPVAKKFQERQQWLERIVREIADDLMIQMGIQGVEWEVTFPEIIVQDRSAKLKDIKFVEDCGYISRERAAEMAVKELDIDEYDYGTEKQKIDSEQNEHVEPTLTSPLTTPAQAAGGANSAAPSNSNQDNPGSADATAVTSAARRQLSMNQGA